METPACCCLCLLEAHGRAVGVPIVSSVSPNPLQFQVMGLAQPASVLLPGRRALGMCHGFRAPRVAAEHLLPFCIEKNPNQICSQKNTRAT